jgi:hypothetical protein
MLCLKNIEDRQYLYSIQKWCLLLRAMSFLMVQHWQHSWLRHYATRLKEAGSIPDVASGIFNRLIPSSRIMALGLTQPLTQMSTRNLPGGKGRAARKADNLTAICESIFQKMWQPRRLTTLWASTVCYRDRFAYTTLTATGLHRVWRRADWWKMNWKGYGSKRSNRGTVHGIGQAGVRITRIAGASVQIRIKHIQ